MKVDERWIDFVFQHTTHDHEDDRLKYNHEMAANIDKVKIVVVGDSGIQNSIFFSYLITTGHDFVLVILKRDWGNSDRKI